MTEAFLHVHSENFEFLHSHQGISKDLAFFLVQRAFAELNFFKILDVDEDVAQHFHSVSLRQDVSLREPK